MTLAFAFARLSIIFAWMSRDHGQRPILSMLRLSIAITEVLSDGVRAEARTPQSYANRSRPSISCSWAPLATSRTSDTPRPRNQSFLQKLALVIALPFIFIVNEGMPELLNKQCSGRHFYSE